MAETNPVERRYLGGEYAQRNPTWDIEDAPWKADQVLRILARHGIAPRSIAEVGCGAGNVLAEMRRAFPVAELSGFDIAPQAANCWPAHAGAHIRFELGDFFDHGIERYSVLLLLDVVEHLPDPFSFLARLRGRADFFVFHIPLDLSALSVLRERPLLHVRDKVGHIHYYTRGLALALLTECGFEIIDARYTGAAFTSPQRTWRTRLAGVARRLAYALSKDLGVRFLGGETLIVLARAGAGG
jgi:SAM-dependent methyltransferase